MTPREVPVREAPEARWPSLDDLRRMTGSEINAFFESVGVDWRVATSMGSRPLRRSPQDRFWEKVDRGGPDECWLWMAQRHASGHGVFWADRHVGAHRFAYELLVGPIPEGLFLDHLCRNPPCVNPAHLEPVTNIENVLRGASLPARNRRKTTCDKGHEFAPRLTGGRYCPTCTAARERGRPRRARAILEGARATDDEGQDRG